MLIVAGITEFTMLVNMSLLPFNINLQGRRIVSYTIDKHPARIIKG
jgi:hypothetical protein